MVGALYPLCLKGQENGNLFLWRNSLRNCGILSQIISQLAGWLTEQKQRPEARVAGGHKDMLPSLGSALYGLAVARSKQAFLIIENSKSCFYVDLAAPLIIFIHLLTEMNRDLPTIIKMKANRPLAEGIYQNNSEILGSTDAGRGAGQAHVFGLALRNEECQNERMKKTTPPPHKPNNGLGNLMLKLSGW